MKLYEASACDGSAQAQRHAARTKGRKGKQEKKESRGAHARIAEFADDIIDKFDNWQSYDNGRVSRSIDFFLYVSIITVLLVHSLKIRQGTNDTKILRISID